MEKKINNTYNIILIVLGLSFLICVISILILIFKSHFVINIDGNDADKSILNLSITHLLSSISAILIFIAFRQQVKQNENQNKDLVDERNNNKADKDYDRYMKLIDDIILYEKRIHLIKTGRTNGQRTIINEEGLTALIIFNVNAPDLKSQDFYLNDFEFYRSFTTYLKNISFIIDKIVKLKNKHEEYYESLETKLLLNIPNLYPILKSLLEYKDEITHDNGYIHGVGLYEQLLITKKQLDLIIPQPPEDED